MIKLTTGDIFASEAQVLVNSVNCCGVMGAGIAHEFRKRFPKMYREYRKICRAGDLNVGTPYISRCDSRWILNFPTKLHFVQPSRLEYIDAGLSWIATNYRNQGIRSLAMPQLGTALGGLSWDEVQTLIFRHLDKVDDLLVELYTTPPVHPTRTRRPSKSTTTQGAKVVQGSLDEPAVEAQGLGHPHDH